MRLRLEVVSIQWNARTRHGDAGQVEDNKVTVVLAPTHPGGDPAHPNHAVWRTRLAFGELRLADMPEERAAEFKLHARYAVDITEEE